MTPNIDRVISIALTDADWRAFTQVQPEPVMWLKARIHETIESSRPSPAGTNPPLGRA